MNTGYYSCHFACGWDLGAWMYPHYFNLQNWVSWQIDLFFHIFFNFTMTFILTDVLDSLHTQFASFVTLLLGIQWNLLVLLITTISSTSFVIYLNHVDQHAIFFYSWLQFNDTVW